jgi:hypothetical protein
MRREPVYELPPHFCHSSGRSFSSPIAVAELRWAVPAFCVTVFLFMATRPPTPAPDSEPGSLYCPNCAEEVTDPLTCGDCSSVICRRCGTALESSDELGIG